MATKTNSAAVREAVEFIQKRKPDFKPKIGLILGSGLGTLAEEMESATRIPFSEIPNFPISTVHGHHGSLVLGYMKGLPVACYQGRIHSYEGAKAEDFKIFVRTLRELGCESLLLTNSSGSLRENVGAGELVLINDHINLQTMNPLTGPNDEEFGPRFYPMDDAYDIRLRERIHQVAKSLQINLHEGVYVCVAGPYFETPAEIRAFRTLGADVVGMSTIPEVLVARHCGLRVAIVSVITNLAAGMSEEQITHEGTLHYGKLGAVKLAKLINAVIESLKNEPC